MSHIYTECGDWDVYFCIGFTTTFIQVNEISLTLFFYTNLASLGAVMFNTIMIMKFGLPKNYSIPNP